MASPNYINANVVPSSDTFREWVDLTNRITYDMEKIVITTVANSQGACTTGNAYVNGIFSSNTLLVSTEIKGTSPNTTVFGTEAATANLTISTNTVQQGILFGQANIIHTGGLFETSSNVNINSTSSTFTSNAALNIFNTPLDVNANVDIDAALVEIGSGNTVIGSNVNINSTATSFTSNAATNIFNTKIDANANVDIDNALTTIDSTNTTIASGELNITSNVNIDAATFDVNDGVLKANSTGVEIDATAVTFTSNATTNIFNTKIDANANLDVDNALSDINSTTFNVLGTTANLNSTTVSVTGTSFVSSANVNITAVNTQIGDANTDILNVAANTIFADKVNVQKAADFDSTVNIDGATTLNSTLDVDGKATFNDTTAANSTVAAVHTDGGLTVAKNAYIVGNTDVDGTITVDGLATFNGNVDLGDATSDTVTFTARVDSGINPNANGSLSLGTTALRWNAFGSTITTTDLYAQSNTYANGNIFLGKGVGATYRISHIAQPGSNTAANNDFYITTIGQVSTANVTHDADRLIVKAQVGNSTIGVMPLAGNTVPLGNGTHRWVMSANTLNASGDITAGSDVDITNEANTNTLRVRTTSALLGLATLSQGITVAGTSNVATFNATGLASLDGGIDVDGAFTVDDTSGNTSTSGTLNVDGATTLNSTLDVDGKVTFNNTTSANSTDASVHTDGGLTVAKNAYIVGNTDIDGTLSVDGAATLNGAVDLGDASADTIRILGSIGGNSTVGIIPSASGRILGTSDKRFAAQLTTVNASSDITAGSDVDITSEANTSTLRVRSTSSFEGAIGFGNSTINANLTANSTQSLFEVDKVVVSDFTASGAVSLPSNTVLNLATANTADLSVTNSASFSAGANVVVTFGNGNGRATIQYANAVVNTNIISDATTRDIGSSSARWGSGYFATQVSVGANTIANTTTLIADDIFARNDLIGNYSSDQALKDNLVVLPQALNKIEQLNGYQFKWNDNIGDERRLTMDYGVVAQELESVLPHAVSINSRGYKSVRYNAILPLLIEAVKELSQRVKELEENNDG